MTFYGYLVSEKDYDGIGHQFNHTCSSSLCFQNLLMYVTFLSRPCLLYFFYTMFVINTPASIFVNVCH
jgi:Na+-driven multidrug efflux pump